MIRHFWCDGSANPNPGPGGFGVVELDMDKVKYIYNERKEKTTNNEQELLALLHVLRIADESKEDGFIVYSDSAYAVNVVNVWGIAWRANGWRRYNNQPIENLEIIKELIELFDRNYYNVTVNKCKGHSGNPGNEICDALAAGNIEEAFRRIEKYKLLDDSESSLDK